MPCARLTLNGSGWQYASHGLVVPIDFVKIGFVVVYTGNCNYAKFSNLFLYRESFGVSFGYSGTDRRNVTSTTNLAGMEAHMEYDSEDNLYRWVQPGRENVEANKYLAWYGETDTQRAKHLLLRERTPEKVVNYYDYGRVRQSHQFPSRGLSRDHEQHGGDGLPLHPLRADLHHGRQLRPDREGRPRRQHCDAQHQRAHRRAQQRHRPHRSGRSAMPTMMPNASLA